MQKIKFRKKIKFFLEYLILMIFMGISRALGIHKASNLFGWLFKKIFQLDFIHAIKRANKIIETNLRHAFPNLANEESQKIKIHNFEHMGRMIGELPHWHKLSKNKFESITKIHDLSNGDLENSPGAITLTPHFGNWEIAPTLAQHRNVQIRQVYKKAKNPYCDNFIETLRSQFNGGNIPNSKIAVREILSTLKHKHNIGMLIDSRYRKGDRVVFFNQEISISTLPFKLAEKQQIKIFPIRLKRLQNTCKFEVTLFPKLDIVGLTPQQAAQKYFTLIEGWIREDPTQYFWIHKLWDHPELRKSKIQ